MSPDPASQMRTERSRLALARPELLRQQAYVAGQWIDGANTLTVCNPATLRALGVVPNLAGGDVERAVEAAERAQAAWQARSASERGAILRRWFELIIRHAADLARVMTAEQGKPLAESRAEVTYAASFVEWFAEEAKRTYGEVIPGHLADKRLVVIKQPVGVVAAITPWNFPAAMVTRKVAPALAVGCTVVLKPSELTPFSALALAFLAEEAGVPAGAFNVVTGEPGPIGEVLTTDPRVRKLTFTGSTPVGKMLAARCLGTVKRLSLELGGNAPFIVFDDADLDRAVEGALASKFRNTGQTCVCANRILVHERLYLEFTRRLAAAASGLTLGDGLEQETQLGPLINASAVAKVERHLSDARERGAFLLTGGSRSEGPGHFFAPTVIADATEDMLVFREETFGPLAAVMPFGSEAQAVAIANGTPAGLAAYVYTRDASRQWRVGEALRFGMIGLNTGLISSAVVPFGGVKESGLGREGSHYGADEYLDLKAMCLEVSPA